MSGQPRGRRDAQRNRQLLLDAALTAFTGEEGTVSLEAIAKSAGVGIGTLYRHFPSREALIEAVYRSELEQLCDQAANLLAGHAPEDALRIWLGRYADFVATKRGMAEALREVIASGAVTSAQTRERLGAAIRSVLDAGISAGTLRDDVRPEDITAAMAGATLAGIDREQIDRLLDLLLDGVRLGAVRPPTT
ncbi:TetR/AcrR family transcriptional regulator [Nocardia nova]|uniref:TetR/AcrR family transcriptional regulator n=1 Tax=Nocardia nova TaxID=37330 RepID=UPI001892E609|nr:TetR/AcrR family transcriptional regulator [Nocardia nova]MBF6147973.1 TetR/AcrR family transcriptional regulator [Nocardia nova]MDN2501403.1 TetR/AcrR family transcriptional regulator [Nocardia nova]